MLQRLFWNKRHASRISLPPNIKGQSLQAVNNQGPWGGSSGKGSSGGQGDKGQNNGKGRNDGRKRPQKPYGRHPQGQFDIDDVLIEAKRRFQSVFGGGSGRNNGGKRGEIPGAIIVFILIGLTVVWLLASFYTVKPEERSVQFFFGQYHRTGEPGLNFAPWPVIKHEIVPVTREQVEQIGQGVRGSDAGLMLTGDENIVDIDFSVVWNINDPAKYLFNLRDPQLTIRSVSESAMREIIAQSEFAPILNRDRGPIADRLRDLVQTTLNEYQSGINIIRVNFDKADPPTEVIDSFRDVQAAEQERDRREKEADAYANRVLAGARGEAAQILQEAEGYSARVINESKGEASRFLAVLNEYEKAPEVTRKRIYLESLEEVFGRVNKFIIEGQGDGGTGSGVIPFLPLNEINRQRNNQNSDQNN